jgi:hypothetical protein
VLVGESGARAHLELTLFTTKAPYDLAALAVDLVDGEGSACGDEQVAVVIYVYGSDVEVVEVLLIVEVLEEPLGTFRWLEVALLETYVL